MEISLEQFICSVWGNINRFAKEMKLDDQLVRQTIQNIEGGKRVRLGTLEWFAGALGLTLPTFISYFASDKLVEVLTSVRVCDKI